MKLATPTPDAAIRKDAEPTVLLCVEPSGVFLRLGEST